MDHNVWELEKEGNEAAAAPHRSGMTQGTRVRSVKGDLPSWERRRELLATETEKKKKKKWLFSFLFFGFCCVGRGLSRRLLNLIVIGCSLSPTLGPLMETAASAWQSRPIKCNLLPYTISVCLVNFQSNYNSLWKIRPSAIWYNWLQNQIKRRSFLPKKKEKKAEKNITGDGHNKNGLTSAVFIVCVVHPAADAGAAV
jgi:hypothetical protein